MQVTLRAPGHRQAVNRLFAGIAILIVAVGASLFALVLVQNRPQSITTTSTSTTPVTNTLMLILVSPLSHNITAKSGSTVTVDFNITAPSGDFIFAVASSGLSLTPTNITSGNLRLPTGVQVTYPLGNNVTVTRQAVVITHLTFSASVQGVVHLEFAVFRLLSQNGWTQVSPVPFLVKVYQA